MTIDALIHITNRPIGMKPRSILKTKSFQIAAVEGRGDFVYRACLISPNCAGKVKFRDLIC